MFCLASDHTVMFRVTQTSKALPETMQIWYVTRHIHGARSPTEARYSTAVLHGLLFGALLYRSSGETSNNLSQRSVAPYFSEDPPTRATLYSHQLQELAGSNLDVPLIS